MNIVPEILERRSIRSYTDRAVEPEVVDRLLEAARHAPSARNVQEWRFVVVTDAARRGEMAAAAGMQAFVGEAPVVIAGCGTNTDYVMSCGHPAFLIDVSIAMEHIALQATREGLGTCWIGMFDESRVRGILGIPDHVRVVQLMTVGYPATQGKPHDRVELDAIVHRERWAETAG